MADDEDHLQELERVWEFITPRLVRAERIYNQALRSIWVGNAGAAVATLTFIGVTWQNKSFHHWLLLVPLCAFVLGLIVMGLGSCVFVAKEARIIKRMERMTSVRDISKLRLTEITSENRASRVRLGLEDVGGNRGGRGVRLWGHCRCDRHSNGSCGSRPKHWEDEHDRFAACGPCFGDPWSFRNSLSVLWCLWLRAFRGCTIR